MKYKVIFLIGFISFIQLHSGHKSLDSYIKANDLVFLIGDFENKTNISRHTNRIARGLLQSFAGLIKNSELTSWCIIGDDNFNCNYLKEIKKPIPYLLIKLNKTIMNEIKTAVDILYMIGYREFSIVDGNIEFLLEDWLGKQEFLDRFLTGNRPDNVYFCAHYQPTDKKFVFIIPSFNNKDWYVKNLDSILLQQYPHWRAIYFDDCSCDGTGALVREYIAAHNLQDKITLIENQDRRLALGNIYRGIHEFCSDDEIAIFYDGDDWLYDNQVLTKLNLAYQDPLVWMTYGSYICTNGTGGCCQPMWPNVIRSNNYRNAPWITSHLRTCYAWLFKKIKKEDLAVNGVFLQTAWDLAFMFPLLEMAAGRFKYIPDVLYIYNIQTPLSENKISAEWLAGFTHLIINKSPYRPLLSLLMRD